MVQKLVQQNHKYSAKVTQQKALNVRMRPA